MKRLCLAFCTVLFACAGDPSDPAPERAEIGPRDFALQTCGAPQAEDICVVIRAGGKNLLINAPAGIGQALGGEALARLDAVLLTGLSARETEGLDEARNRGWTAGRSGPLDVAGPAGLDLLARGLNGAFQTADAVAQVEIAPAGGFSAALLVGREPEGRGAWTAFDTGDLTAVALSAGGFRQAYRISYGGVSLLVRPCGWEVSGELEADVLLTCPEDVREGDIVWPLEEAVVFLTAPTDRP